MGKTLFQRNSPSVIEDAAKLSLDDFIKKYKETTYSTTELLTKAYNDLKPKPEVIPAKSVTFKVVQTDIKVLPITTPLENKPVDRVTSDKVCEPCSSSVVPQVNAEQAKKKVGRKFLPNADKRDERIKELLKEGMKGKEIVEKMKKEGFSVHAPQVTAIKQELEKQIQ